MLKIIGVYLAFCSVLAFWDFDWNSESRESAMTSMKKQSLYMNKKQMAVYMQDLDVLNDSGNFGGGNGRLIHGNEVHAIHEKANNLRKKFGKNEIDWPSKGFFEAIADFFVKPIRVLSS